MSETTSLGAAMFAGSAEGIKKWNWRTGAAIPSDTFIPSISDNGTNRKTNLKKLIINFDI